jgi:hypothetical protein
MSEQDKSKGLYDKYNVSRADGKPLEEDARYFVLRYDGDRRWARHALRAYVRNIRDDFPKLADELEMTLNAHSTEALVREVMRPSAKEVDMISRGSDFANELESLINKHSMEQESDTPDFILAQYLLNCLNVFNLATQARTMWYGGKKPEDT